MRSDEPNGQHVKVKRAENTKGLAAKPWETSRETEGVPKNAEGMRQDHAQGNKA